MKRSVQKELKVHVWCVPVPIAPAAVALATTVARAAAPATYLEFCRQQRLLLPVSLSTGERENVVNQTGRAGTVK